MKTINVGIDLGTTYSAVATFDEATGRVNILKNGIGEEITPSVVYMENGTTLIGQEAKDEQASGNINTVAFYKSMMGDKNFVRGIGGKQFDAEGLSGVFLSELKKQVEAANGVQISGAVITCPAYFNEAQRQATIHAGERAGFRVLKIINEPTAAIIAYGLTGGGKKTVMVYDLGGGTFDVTIAKIDGTRVDVIATNGDHQLGGRNWDKVLVDEIADRFEEEYGVNIASNKEDYTELTVRCEKAKKQLTSAAQATISVRSEGYTGSYVITREEFEDKTRRLMAQTILLTEQCFDDLGGGFGWNSLDEIVLVGGSTRMPQVFDTIKEKFGKAPMTIGGKVDTIVASGAAMQAHLCVAGSITLSATGGGARTAGGAPVTLTISNDNIRDVTSHSLGMLAFARNSTDLVNSIIIKKNSKVGEPYGRDYNIRGDKLEVYVMQGELPSPYECTLLYKYEVTGMQKGKDNPLTVFFQYNQNGVVDVSCSLKNGTPLHVKKMEVKETIDELIERLKRERAEAERKMREAQADITFFIDVSGSMSGSRLTEAKNSIMGFLSQSDLSRTKISIIAFENYCTWLCTEEKNAHSISAGVGSLTANGGTGANPFAEYLQNKRLSSTGKNIIVALTDGEWFYEEPAIESANLVKEKGVIVYAIGIGDANEEFLRKIASKGTAKKVDLSELTKTFEEIAGTIATEAGGSDFPTLI